MKKYIAVKIVEAEECKAWQKSGDNEVGADGYKVKYEEDYISWCPKEVFEKHNRLCNGMTFGQAIEALKQDKRVARQGWNGKDMYLYLVISTELQSGLKYGYGEYQGEPQFVDVICMKTAQNTLVVGWLASQTDMLSDDWVIVEQ